MAEIIAGHLTEKIEEMEHLLAEVEGLSDEEASQRTAHQEE
jgi:hypothetical protein